MKVKIKKKGEKGYTLIELSIVMVLVVMIASTLVSISSQQFQFLKWWNTQKFIAEDAPLVNNMVVRLCSNADAFRVHEDRAQALEANTGEITGSALLLGYGQPGNNAAGTTQWGLIEFDADNERIQYTNVINTDGALSVDASGDSTWTMASGVSNAAFTVASGSLLITLTGPYGGQLTYGMTPSL